MKGHRLIGGILLVSGTAIGAGMLAIPVVSAPGGFFPSLGLLSVKASRNFSRIFVTDH